MIEAYFDGCCEPFNPGGNGGFSFIIKKDGDIIHQSCGFCGKGDGMTNNVAEYQAIIEAMKWLSDNKMVDGIKFKGDSALVINQVSKRWKVKRGAYVEKFAEAFSLSSKFKKPIYEWIPREQNSEADVLSKIGAKQVR